MIADGQMVDDKYIDEAIRRCQIFSDLEALEYTVIEDFYAPEKEDENVKPGNA